MIGVLRSRPAVMIRRGGATGVITSDSFNRANATDMTGQSTDAAAGGTPLAYQSTGITGWGITSNVLVRAANVTSFLGVPIGVPDYEMQVTAPTMTSATGTNPFAMEVRRSQLATSGAGLYRCRWISTGAVTLSKTFGGTSTTLGTAAAGTVTAGATLILRAQGSTITFLVNGTPVITVTDTDVTGSAFCGFTAISVVSGNFENLLITAL